MGIKNVVAKRTLRPRGAGDRTRTGTLSPAVDFESTTSTNSITPAKATCIIHEFTLICKRKITIGIGRKSQAKNAVLFQQTILRYFVHFWQHEKATRQSPAGSLCFIVLFPCYFRVLCVRFSLKYERAGAARPPPPSTRPAPCSHSARLKPFAGSCSSRFGFA